MSTSSSAGSATPAEPTRAGLGWPDVDAAPMSAPAADRAPAGLGWPTDPAPADPSPEETS